MPLLQPQQLLLLVGVGRLSLRALQMLTALLGHGCL